ncbi:hypothetical protein [Sphingomonas sp. NIBR02145]|uniref:hypothetical protein n=1 Tax=Sphingomonas sp. NIBR02145 TaxID=3014784 RepID=UPI0022B45D23|nr:hypothetical protein [Sphingomonas sp. NIBR02145]WHU04120.1 hypothetical protein O3305_05890 [Sphingomonas sp. NIBR02145]
MRKPLLLTALALTAFGASTAAAQDSAEPRDTGRNPFTAPRIEATIGYDQTNEEELGMDIRGARGGGRLHKSPSAAAIKKGKSAIKS